MPVMSPGRRKEGGRKLQVRQDGPLGDEGRGKRARRKKRKGGSISKKKVRYPPGVSKGSGDRFFFGGPTRRGLMAGAAGIGAAFTVEGLRT